MSKVGGCLVFVAASVVILIVLAVIVENGKTPSGTTSPRQTQDSESARNNEEAQYSFEHASQAQMELLKEIQIPGNWIASEGYTIRSQHHKRAWYVGTRIYGPGIEDGVVAVWLISGDKDHPGVMVLAADGAAHSFTEVPHMDDTKAGDGWARDRELTALQDYVKDNVK
jgi:hypothetical protein